MPVSRRPSPRAVVRRTAPGPAVIAGMVALGCAAALSFAAAPSKPAAWKWTPEVIADITHLRDVAMSPDGRRVIYAASRPRPATAPPGPAYANLWAVDTSGGGVHRLTSAEAEDKAPAWSPDGAAFAFLSARADKASAEKPKTRLYVMPAGGGEAWPLTRDDNDVEAFAWSHDGRRIAWIASEPKSEERRKAEKAGRDWVVAGEDQRPRRLWVADVPHAGVPPATLPEPLKVTALGDRSIWQMAWAPDGRAIAATVTDTPKTDDSYMKKRLVVLPLGEGGTMRELVGIVGKIDQVLYSEDGRTVVWRGGVDESDPTPGSLFAMPVAGGTSPLNLTGAREETARWLLRAEGGRVLFAAAMGTRTALVSQSLTDPADRTFVLEPGRLEFDQGSASSDGSAVAFAATIPTQPGEAYVLPTAGKPQAPRRLTDLNPQLAGLPRGRQETVRWKASDGLEIEGVLLHPMGDARRESYPIVVIAHGGPEYENHDGWLTRSSEPGEALSERGDYVFYPNYRGSAGRGVAFAKADHHDLGGREFQDVLDGLDWLAGRERIDLKAAGMTGGSYGGYFSGLAATRYSDRFAAAVALFGISDWLSFLGQSDIPVENSAVHWDLWCYDHLEACRAASPVEHIGKARTPTLIFQGDADPRVPKPQSDELYAALKWKGVPVEYVVYPREKHGFLEREHQVETTRRLLAWFDAHLRP
ncbi:MAG TPA: S9 family peptidase [Candidatus Polarisedimenticolia bacterium]|nr:S9 family peptidase [Candidatus Polarisedimenticolia bacterium]